MYVLLKRGDDYSRKYSRCILQPEGHDSILEGSHLGRKGCLMSVFWGNSDLMVARKTIGKRVHFLTPDIVEHFVCKGGGKRIMQAGIIDFS